MPHLSPMMWLYMMMLVWFSIYLLNSQTWWNSTKKIINNKKINKSVKYNNWNW